LYVIVGLEGVGLFIRMSYSVTQFLERVNQRPGVASLGLPGSIQNVAFVF